MHENVLEHSKISKNFFFLNNIIKVIELLNSYQKEQAKMRLFPITYNNRRFHTGIDLHKPVLFCSPCYGTCFSGDPRTSFDRSRFRNRNCHVAILPDSQAAPPAFHIRSLFSSWCPPRVRRSSAGESYTKEFNRAAEIAINNVNPALALCGLSPLNLDENPKTWRGDDQEANRKLDDNGQETNRKHDDNDEGGETETIEISEEFGEQAANGDDLGEEETPAGDSDSSNEVGILTQVQNLEHDPEALLSLSGKTITAQSDKEEIRKAYHKLSLKCHPDKHGNSAEAKAAFQALVSAFEHQSAEAIVINEEEIVQMKLVGWRGPKKYHKFKVWRVKGFPFVIDIVQGRDLTGVDQKFIDEAYEKRGQIVMFTGSRKHEPTHFSSSPSGMTSRVKAVLIQDSGYCVQNSLLNLLGDELMASCIDPIKALGKSISVKDLVKATTAGAAAPRLPFKLTRVKGVKDAHMLEYLVNQTSGKFLLMTEHGTHCIAVDCDRGLIMESDPLFPHAMALTLAGFRKLGVKQIQSCRCVVVRNNKRKRVGHNDQKKRPKH